MSKKTMKTLINLLIAALIFWLILMMNGCSKDLDEPSLDGTWVEIDSTTSQNPTGCKLTIDQKKGDVTYCGFNFIQPKNTIGLFIRKDAKLFIKDGQMYYRQKKSDFLWLVSIAHEDIYFADYDIDGDFLWLIGETSTSKTTAKNRGKLFKRQ
jgi:hypothetical protein